MNPPDLTTIALKMSSVLLLMTGLIVALLYLFRRLGARGLNSEGKSIRLLSSSYVGVKKYISLVEIPGAILVIGVTRDRITLLDKIEDPGILEQFRQPYTPTDAPAFSRHLSRMIASLSPGKSNPPGSKP